MTDQPKTAPEIPRAIFDELEKLRIFSEALTGANIHFNPRQTGRSTRMASLQDHIETIERYVDFGLEPGSCTRAILENDLTGAVASADHTTRYILGDIVIYLVNKCPGECWGTPKAVAAWLGHHGKAGKADGL